MNVKLKDSSLTFGSMTMQEIEELAVYQTLKAMGWNRLKTARVLHISGSTLRRYIARMKVRGFDIPVWKGNQWHHKIAFDEAG